jgi:hypothetical protein
VHAFRTGTVPCAPPAACGIGGHAGAGPVRVIHAYRFALRPSPVQERALRSHAGASRFAWNWGLARAEVHLRGVRPGHGPGPERRAEPARSPAGGGHRSRYRQRGGNRPCRQGLRLRRSCKTRPGRAVAATPCKREEAGTRHRACGSDRDRRRVTDGCGSYANQCSLPHNGDSAL